MAFDYQKDGQDIVTVTMDMPGRSANVINDEFSLSMMTVVDKLEREDSLSGIIITSAKKTFLAGGDLEMLITQEDPEKTFELVEKGKKITRRLETIGKPVVAAINGAALGGGLELALCCHYRIAIDNSQMNIGLPEVTLGLLPGGGGVARLPRLIGLQSSFPFLIEGKQVNPAAAFNEGIINELASDNGDMLKKAKDWILSKPEAVQPWDKRGYKIPGGTPQHPKIAQMLAIAPAMLRKKTVGNYPAPEAILKAATEGALVDFDTASKIESRYFVKLVTGKVSKNMINAFWFQLNEINSGASRPKNVKPTEIKKLGVLGSGLMGHGITYVSALAGVEVVMTDATQNNADEGLSRIETILNEGLKLGRTTKENIDATLGCITATNDYDKLSDCDLIIEAVFEDRDLKGKVTGQAEKLMNSNGVFASNTSTLPITGLAEKSIRPEKFIGLHFFSPVHKMKLVEIIKGDKTNDETIATAFDFVLKIRKIPIVVNDSRGFYTSRVFSTYTGEGLALLAEGNHPKEIESAGKKAGMPVGPLAVTDEVNLGLVARIRNQTRKDLAKEGKELPLVPADAVIDLMTEKVNRLGRANGGGFYEYPENGKKHLWPELQKHFPPVKDPLTQDEMIERMLFAQVIETIRCYEENVVTSVPDANIGSIFGWGFAPFKGGTLQFVNDYGIREFEKQAQKLAKNYGERFAPPELLIEMAANNQIF